MINERCCRCRQYLTNEERHNYVAHCEECETDHMLIVHYGLSGWRMWERVVFLWWRKITS